MIRGITSIAARSGDRSRLSTFIFHRVLSKADPLLLGEPDVDEFARILDWIQYQFNVLDPLDACQRLQAGSLPRRAAVITFDDGYRDNFDNALPLLRSRSLNAVFFVATGYIGGGAMFNDRITAAVRSSSRCELRIPWDSDRTIRMESNSEKRAAVRALIDEVKYLPNRERNDRVESIVQECAADAATDLMMSEQQIQGLLRAGMHIGGHTRSHPILLQLSEKDARSEIAGCHDDLSAILKIRPALFAYPNGRPGSDFSAAHSEMARSQGFRFAFSTLAGYSDKSTDIMQLRRFTPWDRSKLKFGVRSLLNLISHKQPRG